MITTVKYLQNVLMENMRTELGLRLGMYVADRESEGRLSRKKVQNVR